MSTTANHVRPEDCGLPKASAMQKLTPLDLSMPRMYALRWILCFPLPPSAEKLKIFDELKAGLAYAIAELPWISGELGPAENTDPNHNRIQIQDGIGGVELLYKDLSAHGFPSYMELKMDNFPVSKLSGVHISPLGVIPTTGRVPIMGAQANFLNGGLLLTVCAHHSACDGFGFNSILKIWAQKMSEPFSRGDSQSSDRRSLMQGIPGALLEDFPEYVAVPKPVTAPGSIPSASPSATFTMPPMEIRIFTFSAAALTTIKTAAAAYSTNDALNGFLWRHITLARLLPDDAITTLLHAANIRGRVSPPLPPTYYGNASMACITKHIRTASLASPDGLKLAASAIRASLAKLDRPNCVPLTVGLLDSRPDPTDFQLALHSFLGPDLVCTTWYSFDVYDTVWGSLGRPEKFRVPGDGADGAIIVLPKKDGEDTEVAVMLEQSAMGRLLGDAGFALYAKPSA